VVYQSGHPWCLVRGLLEGLAARPCSSMDAEMVSQAWWYKEQGVVGGYCQGRPAPAVTPGYPLHLRGLSNLTPG